NLLNKIGALSESETVETEQHVVSGYQLLIALSNTTGIAEYLFAHHERWDGTGYPKGLKGGDIPLLSRIIAVVSCYEMMTNDLSNKKPLTKEEAAEELKQGAGSQFDPDLIAAFLKVIAAL
ncbi:MAG TPA: HD domain-containing phosphohydrolase, partial [Candidatus Limnocylindrales bacterium]|nr:HD domain-containing phosphohydrolase [Candidatus Limnocylindrales bacterium]